MTNYESFIILSFKNDLISVHSAQHTYSRIELVKSVPDIETDS